MREKKKNKNAETFENDAGKDRRKENGRKGNSWAFCDTYRIMGIKSRAVFRHRKRR